MSKATRIGFWRGSVIAIILSGGFLYDLPVDAAEKASIPDSVVGIWQSIDNETAGIAQEIQAGKLGDLHQHAFAIRDLVAALPPRSASLPADKLEKVKSDAKFVATLAQRLDAAGDAKDKSASEANFQKLTSVLKSIRENYDGVPK